MAVRHSGWGGKRPGAGRPEGSGAEPEKARRNRIAVMVTDGELEKLLRMAHSNRVPLATCAYQALAAGLRTGKRTGGKRGSKRR